MSKTLITCDCLGTQTIDSQALSDATGQVVKLPCTALCTTQIAQAAEALNAEDVIICCTQEARIFEDLAADLGRAAPALLDLRDRAGWTAETGTSVPKMSALIAEATLPAQPGKTVDVVSEGVCLILGKAEVALAAAEQLKDHLGVTVLLDEADELPETRAYDVIVGQLRRAEGALRWH